MSSKNSQHKEQVASEIATGDRSGTTGFSGQGAEYRTDVSNLFPRAENGGIETFGILENKASYPLGEEPHRGGFQE